MKLIRLKNGNLRLAQVTKKDSYYGIRAFAVTEDALNAVYTF